jgi:toxin ParE1/3/4
VRVVFTKTAEADLESIGDFIANNHPARALSFLAELRQAAQSLAEMPSAYPLVPRYERFGVRRRVHGAYLIFYRIEPDHVVVLHVLHGARNYGQLLAPGA